MRDFICMVLEPLSIIVGGLLLATSVCVTSIGYVLRGEAKLIQPHEAFIVKMQTDAQIKMNEQRCKSVEYCFDAIASIFGK